MQQRAERDLEMIGWGSYQRQVFWAVFNAWMLIMIYVNSAAILMHEIEGISNTSRSYLAATLSAGCVLGCYVSGLCSDKIGRVFCFKRFIFLNIVGSVGLTFSLHYWHMLVFLFILGFGLGCDSVLANTVALESFPPSKASKVTLLSVAWSLGSSFTYILALLVVWSDAVPVPSWRVVVGTSAIYSMYALVERLKLRETPVFLYSHNRFEEYHKVINYIRQTNQILPQESLLEPEFSVEEKGKFISLFKKQYIHTTLILGVLYFFSSFGYSGLLFFMPTFLPVSNNLESYAIIVVQQMSGVPGKLLATFSVDTILGRKCTTALGFFTTGLVLIPFIFVKKFGLVMLCTSVYYLLVNMGLSSLFTQGQELYEGKNRSSASGFLMGMARIGSAVGPILAGFLFDIGGIALAISANIFCFIVIGVIGLCLEETRPHSIQKSFNK